MRNLTIVLIAILAISSSAYCMDFSSQIDDAKTKAKSGDLDGAITICTNIINSHLGAPLEPRARMVLGYILTKKRVPIADTLNQFSAIVNQFPSSPEAPEALLRIGYLRDKSKVQPNEWNRLIEEYPRTKEAAEALHCLGHMALRTGNSALATKRFEDSAAVLACDPDIAEDSLIEAGYSYISQYWQTCDKSFLDNAVSYFKSIESKPRKMDDLIRARLGMGEVYLINGCGAEAAQEYQAVLDMHPTDPYLQATAEFELACALYSKRDWQAALAGYDVFLSHCAGSTLLDKHKQWRLNRPGYQDLITTNPERAKALSGLELVPFAAYWKAYALFKLERYSESKLLTDDILSNLPGTKIQRQVEILHTMCANLLREGK